MALLDSTSSPTSAPSGAGGPSRSLDTPPPMPSRQRRPPNVLFTPPADENAGMGAMGNDPAIRLMTASAAVDKAFQQIAIDFPLAVDPLAQLQQAFRQLVVGITTAQSGMGGGMGAPNIVPPLPMQSGMTQGMEQGPNI